MELDDQTAVVLTVAGGAVPIEEAATYIEIGETLPPSVKLAPAMLILTGSRAKGSSARLDRHIMRNVVFRDMQIVYEGGPLVLQNVRFINCRLIQAKPSKGVQEMLAAVLEPPSVDFKST